MRPLRVALIHRDSDRCTDKRMVGIWSYPVPEFEWDHCPVAKGFQLDRAQFDGYDLIFYEDGKLFGKFIGKADIPVAYYVVDSTLTDHHYLLRRQQARQCDLILVDHDELQRFRWRDGPPVRRLSHCVNDRWFYDYGIIKTIDVSFHCRTKGSAERAEMEEWLEDFCVRKGYLFESGTRYDQDYARAFNRSKVTVNLSRTPTNRPHRVLDAMACRTCLITNPLPVVSDERLAYYVQYEDKPGGQIDEMLDTGRWKDMADKGCELIHAEHTWAVRAKQLSKILGEELGL